MQVMEEAFLLVILTVCIGVDAIIHIGVSFFVVPSGYGDRF